MNLAKQKTENEQLRRLAYPHGLSMRYRGQLPTTWHRRPNGLSFVRLFVRQSLADYVTIVPQRSQLRAAISAFSDLR